MLIRRRPVSLFAAVGASLAILIATAALASRAHADPRAALEGETIEVTAEELDLDVKAGTAVLSGQVTLKRGELKITCPRLDARYGEGPRLTWAKASGGVRAELKDMVAEAPEAEIDLSRNVLELRGGALLVRGQGHLRAQRASIDLSTSKVTLKEVRGSLPIAVTKP